MDSNRLKYFASLPTKEIGAELVHRKEEFYNHLEKIGHFSLLKASHLAYFKASYVNGRLQQTGENFEFTEIEVNHFRNLIQHSLSLITSQRPQFEPKASNTDYKSMAQTQLASSLLEYYMRTKKMERFIKQATEHALYLGEGWIYCGWNATEGKQYTSTEHGIPIYEGDIEFESYTPLNVIRDVTKTDGKKNWYMTRRFRNKFDLAAKYPELAERIISTQAESYNDMRYDFREWREARKDDIPLYAFYHERTEALPEGRIVEFIDSDIILTDGPLPYHEIPLYPIVPAEREGSIFGYTNFWDILPLQQAMDKLHSTVVTNQSTFGVQNIMAPKGNDLNVTQLQGGLNYIEYDAKAGPPQALQLTSTPVEVFNYIGMLEQAMETLSGINSVARGNPEQSLKSGSALALVQSMAIQFSQSLQQSYAMLLEDLGTAVINLLRDYATVPRIALISGKSNRSQLKEFKGDDLMYIQRVMVDMGNPLMRTTGGRVEVATQLIQAGLIKNPEQYLEVLTTGRLEPMYENELAELNLIRSENERLQEGGQCLVLRTDTHEMHVLEHKTLLSSPEAREVPELVNAALAHIQEHEQLMAQAAEQAGAQALEANKNKLNQEAQAKVDSELAIAKIKGAENPTSVAAEKVRMPSMPKIPTA